MKPSQDKTMLLLGEMLECEKEGRRLMSAFRTELETNGLTADYVANWITACDRNFAFLGKAATRLAQKLSERLPEELGDPQLASEVMAMQYDFQAVIDRFLAAIGTIAERVNTDMANILEACPNATVMLQVTKEMMAADEAERDVAHAKQKKAAAKRQGKARLN